jgi:soluble lytic murein transglycosylase-like protein
LPKFWQPAKIALVMSSNRIQFLIRSRLISALICAAVLLLAGSIWYALSDNSATAQAVPAWRVWREVQTQARAAAIDPGFVYAIIWAESSLRPGAESSVARGMMQLTEAAWTTVSNRPYWQAWDWRVNVSVGIDYLAYCRSQLESAGQFSYPLLAASYRYGPNHVRQNGYDLNRIRQPDNPIYAALFAGEMHPVQPQRWR